MADTHVKARAATLCSVEVALRDWAKLQRAGKPAGETPLIDDTPWDKAVYEAEERAVACDPTSHLGATFQMLVGLMYGDPEDCWTHRAGLSAYRYLRGDSKDRDLLLAERHYFGGRALYTLTDLPASKANVQHWLRQADKKAWAQDARKRAAT